MSACLPLRTTAAVLCFAGELMAGLQLQLAGDGLRERRDRSRGKIETDP